MLSSLGIICGFLFMYGQICAATNVKHFDDNLKFTNVTKLVTSQYPCQVKNSTYFICCMEYKVSICFEGQYLPKDIGIKMTLLINNKIYWQEIISETSPPEICPADIPEVGELCLKFYDVQIKQYHFCLNVSIKLDVIHRIPLKRIHIGCFNGANVLPMPLNCTVSNTSDTSFDLDCDVADHSNRFWLEVKDSANQLVQNKTDSTPQFAVSQLHPGSKYSVFVFAVNKYGYSSPTLFNITTKQQQIIGRRIANAVVNVTLMQAILAVLSIFLLVFVGFYIVILCKRYSPTLQQQNITFAQMKDDLAHKLLPEESNSMCPSLTYE